MYKIKKGDKVIILAGKDKGKQGVVLRIVNSKLQIGGRILKS
ncbi:MAG: KOW motif-containing protein, partial [Gammaproteobacteria bacterium]